MSRYRQIGLRNIDTSHPRPGNMFDWGAQAVAEILEGDQSFGLKSAMSRILDSSWICNGLPEFLKRIKASCLFGYPIPGLL